MFLYQSIEMRRVIMKCVNYAVRYQRAFPYSLCESIIGTSGNLAISQVYNLWLPGERTVKHTTSLSGVLDMPAGIVPLNLLLAIGQLTVGV
jgi:hypothetical protein